MGKVTTITKHYTPPPFLHLERADKWVKSMRERDLKGFRYFMPRVAGTLEVHNRSLQLSFTGGPVEVLETPSESEVSEVLLELHSNNRVLHETPLFLRAPRGGLLPLSFRNYRQTDRESDFAFDLYTWSRTLWIDSETLAEEYVRKSTRGKILPKWKYSSRSERKDTVV